MALPQDSDGQNASLRLNFDNKLSWGIVLTLTGLIFGLFSGLLTATWSTSEYMTKMSARLERVEDWTNRNYNISEQMATIKAQVEFLKDAYTTQSKRAER